MGKKEKIGTYVCKFDNQELREFPSDDSVFFLEISSKNIWRQEEGRILRDWEGYRFKIKFWRADERINWRSVVLILGGDEGTVELGFWYSWTS